MCQPHALVALSPVNEAPHYTLVRRLGGPLDMVVKRKKKIPSLPMLGINPSHPAHRLVTILS